MRRPAAAFFVIVLLVATSAGSTFAARRAASAFVRVNQVGYTNGEAKRALLMADRKLPKAVFEVVDAGGTVVYRAAVDTKLGPWNKQFAHVDLLDFSPLTQTGTYTIRVAGLASSPAFRVEAPICMAGC